MGHTELNLISRCNQCGCQKSTREKMNALNINENSNCPSCNHRCNNHFD